MDLLPRSSFIIHRFPQRYLSVALSVGLLRVAVSDHRALCSSDFPHPFRNAITTATAITSLYGLSCALCGIFVDTITHYRADLPARAITKKGLAPLEPHS